jgi:hypothetical protein
VKNSMNRSDAFTAVSDHSRQTGGPTEGQRMILFETSSLLMPGFLIPNCFGSKKSVGSNVREIVLGYLRGAVRNKFAIRFWGDHVCI